MSNLPAADRTLIGRQMQQLLAESHTLRHDMTVLTAMVRRLDGTLSACANEIRATWAVTAP